MRADFELNAVEQAVERDLRRYYAAGEPAQAFVARLEQQLSAQAVTASTSRHAPGFFGRWLAAPRPLRWAVVALALLLVAAITVGALGPQRVWAEVQRLLGYVPGIGFVDLNDTRVLVAPVEVTREGMTVRVEQGIAERERTRVVMRSLGLPPSDTLFRGDAGVSRIITGFSGRLRLPDGSTLDFKELFLQYGEAASRLEFAGLPADAMSFTLEMDRLPLVPPGRAPEGWHIPITLVSARAPGTTERFPEPYKPEGASDKHHGVTISVENVVHTADETVIKMSGTWTDPALQIYSLSGGVATPFLIDNVGHVYGFKPTSGGGGGVAVAVVQKAVEIEEGASPAPTPAVRSLDGEFSIEPLSAFASEVTLQVESIQSEVEIGDTFRVTIPEGAKVGDHWPLALTLDVAGFRVRLTGAALETDRVVSVRDGPVDRTLLTFEIAPIPDVNGKRLGFFHIEAREAGWSSGAGSSNARGEKTISLVRADNMAVLPGPIDVTIHGASVQLLGPWRMTWAVPGREGEVAEPATLHPTASDTHDGLTLAVKEVVHTDRLTHVLADLQDPPPGVELAQAQVLLYDKQLRADQRGFEDDRGRRYELDRANIGWLRPGETYALYYQPKLGAQSLRLPPVDPLARRFTLTLPTIEVLRAGTGSFTVTVPANVVLKDHPQAPGVIEESAPWPVDIAVEVDDQTVRYSEARLTAQHGHLWVILGNSDRSPFSDAGVSGLCGMKITGPTGEAVTSAQDNFVMSPGPCAFAPGFSPQDAAGRLAPGEYRVSFDGIAVRVPGPWRLSWER